MKSYISRTRSLTMMFCLSFILFACGGGGGGGNSSSSITAVSGTVLAGPASGAIVSVKLNGNTVATSTATAVDGSYTVAIPTSLLSRDLIFEANGGTFPDEATSTTGVAMGIFSSFIPGGTLTSGSNVTIDPSSTILHKLVAGGRSKTEAEAVFASAFGYTPDCSVKPAFATMSSASSTSQRLSGLRTAAFSQLTMDLGLTPAKQFELIQALADDLSDGILDGFQTGGIAATMTSGTIPVDIANRFAKALMTFQTSSLNKSKLTIDKIEILPFAKKALTHSYMVEYIPGMLAATQGKTTFRIKLTNLSDGLAATGKTITVVPKMYMETRSHSAPVDTVIESTATPGTYDCSVYYQMASGPGMGVWELKVSIGGESAIFYPPVAMSMGTTSRATLKGVTDVITSMTGPVKRTYNLFNDGSTFGMSSTFKLFIAASDDSMMMNFPVVSIGSSLTGLTVTSMTVEASTDNGVSWNSLTDNGSGHWSVTGLTGLATGGTIKVRIFINGEQKTTDGNAAVAGTNNFATFTIVTGM